MFQRRGSQLCIVLAIVFCVAAKPPPGVGSTWASYAGKPVASRALGLPPISGIGTINIPYMPKSPIFPKFVDPKMMISKKTDLLSNLFGGLGPIDGSGSAGDSSYYSTPGATNTFGKTSTTPDNTVPYKRGIFGPMASPFASMGPMGMGPVFNPMAGKFSPMGLKFPFGGLGSTDPDSYDSSDSLSRRKRSAISSTSTAEMENFLKSISSEPTPETSTKDAGPPPPYPGLAPISEEPEGTEAKTPLLKLFGPPAGVTGFRPGFAPGPFAPGPFAANPFVPVVGPGMFMAKKSAFLDTLFKNLATTTPTPEVTDTPIPKKIFRSKMLYHLRIVSDFLDKLFDSLALNMTLNSTTPDDVGAATTKVARSVDDLTTISAAKDAIVDSILSELGDIKGSMVSTLNDLITYEKTVAAASAPKKPFKPFKPFPPAPTVDAALPFQQRMSVLSQVFDMLTELQRNITTAVQETVKPKAASADELDVSDFGPYYPGGSYSRFPDSTPVVNMTLLDAIKSKLSSIPVPSAAPSSGYGLAPKKVARIVPNTPTSVWVSYPPSDAASLKREVDDGDDYPLSENHSNSNQYARAVNMQMHQGYQSMPPGIVETVQAGGGSVPGNQVGVIKLFDSKNYEDIGSQWADWAENIKNQYKSNNRHHHNHH
ncbi:uncharacterized protein LOC117169898 [Belonocnema kinseyi]|uniref:uncharacterized protein LOC117169898 n=1 Tax=Belonocnema kinseyi TaxID=2817044 RepID=UPI00143D679B|nr:uncharacterized protein LOC117169898 [Belonocnema kinseyi]